MSRTSKTEVSAEVARTKWDAIVIGSGLGGMTTAVSLANAGKKVLVLEQHSVPGGYATSFRRKGFTFEVSLHQTPGLGEGQLLHEILTRLGVMQKITAIRLDEAMAITTPVGTLTMGGEYLDQLRAAFPQESRGIDRVEALVTTMRKEIGRMGPLAGLPPSIFRMLAFVLAPTLRAHADKTLSQCLDEIFEDDLLKQLVAIQWGYFGLPLGKISSILYMLGWGGFLQEGIYYIKGTSQALSNAFVERLEELGGRVLLRQRVERILVEDGRAVGVCTRRQRHDGRGDAHELRASVVVSNASPQLTYNELVGRQHLPSTVFEQMARLETSASATVLYVGLDCPLSTLTGETYHSKGYLSDAQLDMDAVFEKIERGQRRGFDGFTDYGCMDPDLAPPGKTALAIIRIERFGAWENLTEDEYGRRKAEVTEEVLADIEEKIPGFRQHIEVLETGTPRTMQRYTGNPDGAFNGFAYTPARVGMGQGGIAARSPLAGLFLSSAWAGAMSGGFYGCIVNGAMTSRMICRAI